MQALLWLVDRVKLYPTLADRANKRPAGPPNNLMETEIIASIRDDLCFKIVHWAWDAKVERRLPPGFTVLDPIGAIPKISFPKAPGSRGSSYLAFAGAMSSRLEKELWAEILSPGGYEVVRRKIFPDEFVDPFRRDPKVEVCGEISKWLLNNALPLTQPQDLTSWRATLRDVVVRTLSKLR